MKKSKQALCTALALTAVMLIVRCTEKIAGNTSETGNAVTAIMYNPGGSPAVHAKIKFIPINYNPHTGGLGKTTAKVDSATTDANGAYTAKLDTGTYNILAQGDSGVVYQDSIVVVKDSTVHPAADTLKAPGSIRGVVRLQPGDDARKVFIIAMGTNTFSSPEDAAGNFALADMAEGRYKVRIMSILDNYGVLDTSLEIRAGKSDSLADTIVLPYTGIPVPSGLKISYDTLKQIVTLSWSKPTTGRTIAGYNIYRKNQDSTSFERIKSGIADTEFADSTLAGSGAYEYRVAALDTQNTEGVQSVSISVNFQNRFKLATSTPAFGKRQNHSSVVFNGKMWVIGGSNVNSQYNNDIWSSIDGITWNLEIDSASFPKREFHTSIVFNNKIWVIGGLSNIYDRMNDVWYSSDGINWTLSTASAEFSPRYGHSCVVSNNKIWLIGGVGAGMNYMNDVWYSSDGITWNQSTSSATFSAREGYRAISFNDKIWVIGGTDANGSKNDVWYSADGILWTQATAAAAFSQRYYHSAVASDSLMWISGGLINVGGISTPSSDVWYSNDGINWLQFQAPPEYLGRYGHTSLNFNSRIWIIGQINNSNISDVWYLQ